MFDNMVVTCMPNSGHGGHPGTWVMTIFGSYVDRHFANIQYFNVCGGIWRYIKVFGGIWRYMKVYKGIWTHFIDIVFFLLFGGPLSRHFVLFNLLEVLFFDISFFTCLGSHFSDIVLCSVFVEGLQPQEVAHLFSREISHRMSSESCPRTPWGPSYEHICKNIYFCQGRCQWDPWLKRALKTISNGVLKVQNAWICVNFMRIFL